MHHPELIPHLFRTEFARITAVLAGRLGKDNLEVAEDIASDTFLAAMETWPFQGIPPAAKAWLYAVARNKTINYLRKKNLFERRISADLRRNVVPVVEIDFDLSEENFRDSQLELMFALSRQDIPEESRIALALRVLCGFGIDEIAAAFLTSRETILKRLQRARQKLRQSDRACLSRAISHPPSSSDLAAVLTTLYLLFSEGYYSETHPEVVREDLCFEAMRLISLLTEHSSTNRPEVLAAYSLMCFQASRLPARKTADGGLVIYSDQDPHLWDRALIEKGVRRLHEASAGDHISHYHLEATIAYWYTVPGDTPEKWNAILSLYDLLINIHPSPPARLNRLYAMGRVSGELAAIREAEKLQLPPSRYYFALMGELYKCVDLSKSRLFYEQALALTKAGPERDALQKRLINPGNAVS